MELILHPGMPKCGSSSIQHALIGNVSKLADSNIFVLDKSFALSDLNDRKGHYGVPYNIIYDILNGKVKLEELVNNIRDYLERVGRYENSKVVLSSELLSGVNSEAGLNLHEGIERLFDKVSVWIYVRAPWNQFFSNWRQGVYREGFSFNSYAEKRVKETKTENFWGKRLAGFYKTYSNVNVVALESLTDVREHFFRNALGLENEFVFEKNSNPSLCPIFCDALSLNPRFFESELQDIEYRGYRHKNHLMSLLNNVDSTIFSNLCTVEHFNSLLKLKEIYEPEYIRLVSSTEKEALNISAKLESDIEKYRLCVVRDSEKDIVVSNMFFDFLTAVKKLG